jgi:signal transduction histidine kinase
VSSVARLLPLDRDHRALEIIRDLGEILLHSLETQRLLDALLEGLERNFGVAHSYVLLPVEAEGASDGERDVVAELEVVAARGAATGNVGVRIPFGVGSAGVAAARRRTVRIGNMRANRRYLAAMISSPGSEPAPGATRRDLVGLPDSDSQLAVPLIVGDELSAVLVAESAQAAIFTTEDAAIFEVLTSQIASAIRNARIAEGLEQARAEEARQRVEAQRALRDLQIAQAALIQTEKLAGVGQLAAGIAHEVNTPLGAILASVAPLAGQLPTVIGAIGGLRATLDDAAWARLLSALADPGVDHAVGSVESMQAAVALSDVLGARGLDEADDLADMMVETGLGATSPSLLALVEAGVDETTLRLLYRARSLRDAARTIELAAEKARKVVLALKTIVHQPAASEARQPVDVRAGLETVLTVYQNALKHGITVVRDMQGSPRVIGHAEQLSQVWTNILHNAVDAMGGKGTIWIGVASVGDRVEVSIGNDGPAIPDDVAPRIFDAFFTTKKAGEGTGLGLHLCRQIVDAHAGTIRVERGAGRTTFVVWLRGELEQTSR